MYGRTGLLLPSVLDLDMPLLSVELRLPPLVVCPLDDAPGVSRFALPAWSFNIGPLVFWNVSWGENGA